MRPEPILRLTPGKRVLFLTKDPELIRRQLRGELDLRMQDLSVDDLLDDINTDAMTPAWVCFDYKPEDIARNAYAGLIVNGERLFPADALRNGNFEVIVSGYRKGVGSSRETATQCEVFSGIKLAVAVSRWTCWDDSAADGPKQMVKIRSVDLMKLTPDGWRIFHTIN